MSSKKLTNAELRARIERLIKQWRPILGLETWHLEFKWDEKKHAASCESLASYESAELHFNAKMIREEWPTYHLQRQLVVHELVHCLIWKSSEREVVRITRSLLRAAGLKYE